MQINSDAHPHEPLCCTRNIRVSLKNQLLSYFLGKALELEHTKKNHKHHNESNPNSLAACTNNIKQDFFKVTEGRPKPLWCNCLVFFQALWTFRNKSCNFLINIIIIIVIVQNLDTNAGRSAYSSKLGWKH